MISVDLISVYHVLDRSLIKTLKSINILVEHEDEHMEYVTRLRERKYSLSESVKRHVNAVTAHDLKQYRNVFNTVKVEEATQSWITELLRIDEDSGL